MCNAFRYKSKCEEADQTLRKYLEFKTIKHESAGPSAIKCETYEETNESKTIHFEPIIILDPLNEAMTFEENDRDSDNSDHNLENDADSTSDGDELEQSESDDDAEYNIKNAKERDGRYECYICQKTLADPKTLKLHIRLHTGKNLKHCTICDRGFAKKNHLTRHMASHEKKEYPCEQCQEVFDSLQERRVHISREHPKPKPTVVKKTTKAATQDPDDAENSVKNDAENENGALQQSQDEAAIEFNIQNARQPNGRYECHICQKSLADPKTLKLHIRLHTGQNLKHCPICQRGFAKKNHLTRHMASHEKKEYPCEQCAEVFDHFHERRLHMSTEHRGTRLNVPKSAGKKGKPQQTRANKLIKVAANESTDIYGTKPNGRKMCVCRICDAVFDSILNLRSHLQWHSDDDESFNGIDWTLKEKLLFNPMVLADQIYNADQLKGLIKRNLKDDHETFALYQITNESGFELSLTDSETEDECTVVQAGPPRYTCFGCQKEFNRSHQIMDHMKEHPLETVLNKFTNLNCPQCRQYFPCIELLSKHQRTQCGNEQKQFICKFCNYHFMWENNYNKHLHQMHPIELNAMDKKKMAVRRPKIEQLVDGTEQSREKGFRCNLCPQAFYRQEHLSRHRKIHIPSEKKFSCDLCKKRFNRKDNLK